MDAWDNRNRLVCVSDRATDGGVLTKVVDFLYDTHNRWIGRVVDLDGAEELGAETTRFVYDENQIILQLDGEGDLTHRYLWGPVVDQILGDEQVASVSSAGDVLWPLTDQIGTVRDLAEFSTADNTTAIVNHRIFDSFGDLKSQMMRPALFETTFSDCVRRAGEAKRGDSCQQGRDEGEPGPPCPGD